MASTFNGILFSLEKEGNSDSWRNQEHVMLSEVKQSQKDKSLLLREVPRVIKITGAGSGQRLVEGGVAVID